MTERIMGILLITININVMYLLIIQSNSNKNTHSYHSAARNKDSHTLNIFSLSVLQKATAVHQSKSLC